MKYCKECVQPDTRPGIYFSEDGICGACLWEEEKKKIDWEERRAEMKEIVAQAKEYRKKGGGTYDCAIGVSGGKDSTFQAIYAREVMGLRPLLVNCEPFENTEIGKYNIENLKRLGFDTISVRANPKVSKQLMIRDFYDTLNIVRPLEYTLWASAYIIADKFDIGLVIQGENPGQTLGVTHTMGTDGDALKANLQNTIKKDPLSMYLSADIVKEDLFLYSYDRDRIRQKGIQGMWLSNYVREWSQPHNAKFAMEHGLRIREQGVDPYEIGTYRRFSQLDAGWLLEVNQMFKHVKLGFGQATDHVCYDIREGLLSREEGIYLVKELDGVCGKSSIEKFCKFAGLTVTQFWEHVNKFRGEMWMENKTGTWILREPIWTQTGKIEKISIKALQNRLGM